MKSKWANDEQDAADAARRKEEKEEKKRIKAEKQRRLEEEQARQNAAAATQEALEHDGRRFKRRRLSDGEQDAEMSDQTTPLLRFETGTWAPSRSIKDFEMLNHIEEGTYGSVSRARDLASNTIVALKKMKLEGASSYGVPVTCLREIQTLQRARHKHIITLHEVITSSGPSSASPLIPDIYLSMEFAAHDLKSLLTDMPGPFTPSETKSLVLQLASALSHLHSNSILHRDIKTSNILMLSTGRLKLADFGMARFTSSPPPPNLTTLVVTLWYRSPELLLGAREYDAAVDMWSLGCVFAELLTREPILQGRNEVDQLGKIFELIGTPNEKSWPGWRRLPNARSIKTPSGDKARGGATKGKLRGMYGSLTSAGRALLEDLLCLDPEKRLNAEEVLEHEFFLEDPKPKREEMFPSFPSKAGGERRWRNTPPAPVRGGEGVKADFSKLFA